ncbi:Vacuolar protein 8, partial [Ascosphaera atra]
MADHAVTLGMLLFMQLQGRIADRRRNFAVTMTGVHEVGRETLEPILFLLQNPDAEVQRAASAALGNLAVS